MANHIADVTHALHTLDPHTLTALAALVRDVRIRGGTLWLAGNGGSFATALHWACDLQKVTAVRAQVLGGNAALLTAWSNDEGYAQMLVRELERGARNDDALLILSCSGTSPNIWPALVHAQARRLPTVLLTGLMNAKTAPADLIIRVPSHDYGVIEDCHSIIGHWLTKELAQ
jgi:D-sedoheptulose 7-phosphate isomerase